MEQTERTGTTGVPAADAEITLAAGLDQIEAAIDRAHRVIDDIHGDATAEKAQPTAPGGARQAMLRCQVELEKLCNRLEMLKGSIGRL